MQPTSISFEIESIMSDLVIGYRGVNLINIQKVSGANVRVSKSDCYGRRKVKITGTQKQQQTAVSIVEAIIGKKIQKQSESAGPVPKRILKRGSGPLSLVALGPAPVQCQQSSHSTQVEMICNPSGQMYHPHQQPQGTTYPHLIKQQFPLQTSRTAWPLNENKRVIQTKTNMYLSRKSRLPTILENLLEAVPE